MDRKEDSGMKQCKVELCYDKVKALGLCSYHYYQARRPGGIQEILDLPLPTHDRSIDERANAQALAMVRQQDYWNEWQQFGTSNLY